MTTKNFFIGIALIVISGSAGYWLGHMNTSSAIATTPSPENTTSNPAGAPVPTGDGTMTYASKAYGFTFQYPSEMGEVQDTDEGNGAHTIVLQNPAKDKGFQIYVEPYSGSVITKEKFKADNPSGVMNDPVDVVIDGERATIFYGKADGIGDTRELWFIHKGYLYEIVTYKQLDTWLADIMKTWKFI